MTEQQKELKLLFDLLLYRARARGEKEFVAAILAAIVASPSLRFLAE